MILHNISLLYKSTQMGKNPFPIQLTIAQKNKNKLILNFFVYVSLKQYYRHHITDFHYMFYNVILDMFIWAVH